MFRNIWAAVAAVALLGGSAAIAAENGDYWIGVACEPVPGALRAVPGPEHHAGLMVANVIAESPAGKAGIREDDVLLEANGKPLATIADLIQSVNMGKDKKLSLRMLRDGKPLTIDVQPQKRPQDISTPEEKPGRYMDLNDMQRWIERMGPGGPSFQFHLIRPGRFLPPGAALYPDLPGDMTVIITKHGNEPAKIEVRQGDKTFAATEKDLDKLPKDVRPHVERMLSPMWHGMGMMGEHGGIGGGMGIGGSAPPPPAAPGLGIVHPDSRVQKRLDEMGQRLEQTNRQIEELRKSLDQLRSKKPVPESGHPL
jgi:membrane-associated protease RseP (regulator of RpoE activity)